MEEIIFMKELCPTDVNIKLIVPTASLTTFNIPNGQHVRKFEATDTIGIQWNLRLSVRRNDSNLRPEITGDWLRFVGEKGLKAGKEYRVIFSKRVNEITGEEQFFIKAEKKIFRVWANMA